MAAAADDMGWAPSPGPSSDDSTGTDNITIVEALVITAIAAMLLLHVLGSLRRRSSSSLLHALVMGVYTLSYPLVSFTIGRMDSSDWYTNDFAVWAVFLLLLLGSTDTLTACRLNDIDNWKSMYVKHIFKGFLLGYVLWQLYGGYKPPYYLKPLLGILFVVVVRWYVRIASMRMVSKSYLCKNMVVVAKFMQKKDNLVVPFDPVTMEGYSYMLVAGEDRRCSKRRTWCIPCCYCYKGVGFKVTTVEEIWQCKGRLMATEHKDVCLSMALSRMLNRRIAGFKISEAELEKTHVFVFKGLLLAGDKPYQRAFKIIEEELVFVHDMYYTRYYYLYQKSRYLPPCLPVIMFALCSWLTTCLIVNIKNDEYMRYSTICLTVVLAFLEVYQLHLYIASGWFKVALLLSYTSTSFLRRSRCLEMIIGLVLRLKTFAPWKRSLGQYCVLQDLGRKSWVRNCLHYATLYLVDKANKRRKSSVELSENVKQAMVDSLLRCNGRLTNGVTSLQNNGVHGRFSWACDATATDGMVARTIIVWHIATTLCHHQLDAQARENDTVRTASTLSQYCLHLLAFAPSLLPGHSSISESILDQSIDEAGELLRGAKTLESRCEKLMEMGSTVNAEGANGPLVLQGARLARHLLQDIQEQTRRWKVLSDFWAEMLLYVSPSDDARAHLERLVRGGEFITHLWALLTHAGILERGYTGPPNV